MVALSSFRQREAPIAQKLGQLNWGLVLLITGLCAIGFAMLYSAADGNLMPWAMPQMVRFGIGIVVMVAIAVSDMRVWMRWCYALHAGCIGLLILVMLQGHVGGGAQRWLNLGVFQVQPSELAKLTLMLCLARYFHAAGIEQTGRILHLIPPLLLMVVPVGLIAKQPDLGTALMLLMATGAIFFVVGVRWWKFVIALAVIGALVPVVWTHLHDYQKARVLVFLDPGRDPLGAGYHIIQSKIALGSGGIEGKGFMMGTQSHLDFLPEKQTDFIFTMLAEEFGLFGAAGLIGLYGLVIVYGYAIAFRAQTQFGRILAFGITTFVFLSVFINMAMVMGMIPAKGVPLPLVSYGGTSLIVTLCGFGLLMNVWIHRDLRVGKRPNED